MILKHSRELATPDEAKAWFGIMPDHPANVLSISQATTV